MTDETSVDLGALRRYREASEWLLKLREAETTEDDVERWLKWCDEGDDNLASFERLQSDWGDLEGLRTAPNLTAPLAGRARGLRQGIIAWTHSAGPTPVVLWALAACAAGIVWASYPFLASKTLQQQTITAISHESTTLPDGSSLLLSAKAAADVDFTGPARNVALQPGGEAYFKVHHDKGRPFIVRAGAVTVTAVGTAFDVRRDTGHVTVTVEEGVVALIAPGPNGPVQWLATAGYQVNYSEQERTAVVSNVDPQRVMRWRSGELAYDGSPLGVVIADINRYSTVHVEIRDPELQQLRFTGTVFVASIRDWLRAVEEQYPLTTSESGEGVIALRATTPSAIAATR